jgi:hypothetical protein
MMRGRSSLRVSGGRRDTSLCEVCCASPAAVTLLKERPCPLLSSAAPGCRPQRLQRSRRFAVRGRDKKRPDLRARAENAQNCFLPFLLSTMTASAVLFLFNVIETKFLRASSTWEFSHSLDPMPMDGDPSRIRTCNPYNSLKRKYPSGGFKLRPFVARVIRLGANALW